MKKQKIKTYAMAWILGLICLLTACTSKENNPREVININAEWKYSLGDKMGAEQMNYDDSQWESIGLPHSFSVPYFMSSSFYVGYGWYRKHLALTEEDLNRKIFLEFDGVFQEAEVFVNGKLAGKHTGGYTGFSVDISECIQAGDNVVSVRVNNHWQPDVAPRAGEHAFSGGIYRNVYLVKKDPVHIDWYGTFITTPQLAEQNGASSSVKIETELCNQTEESATYRLETRIFDAKGKEVAIAQSTDLLAPANIKSGYRKQNLSQIRRYGPLKRLYYTRRLALFTKTRNCWTR